MTVLAKLTKAPADRLDYDIYFGRWLPEGDIIVSAVAVVDDTTVTFLIDETEITDQTVRVWVDAGLDGEESEITVNATTQGGREKEACFLLRIKEC